MNFYGDAFLGFDKDHGKKKAQAIKLEPFEVSFRNEILSF
jgi:hypothetical protein